jgi:hypothetical protein
METKTVKLPQNPFGGVDEQAAQDMFEDMCGGVSQAEHLMRISQNSYPTGTKYDFLMGRGRTKEENFRISAKEAGYTESTIDFFLAL